MNRKLLSIILISILSMSVISCKNEGSGKSSIEDGSLSASSLQMESAVSSESASVSSEPLSSDSMDSSASALSQTAQASVATSQASSKPASQAAATPTSAASGAINFDDPLLESLLRSYIKKPAGACLPSDFAVLSRIQDTIHISHDFVANITRFGNSKEIDIIPTSVTGLPSSFAVLSQIPVRNIYLDWFIPEGREDISLTFNLSWIASSKKLITFSYKAINESSDRFWFTKPMTFTNFASLSACTDLKALVLWDCKGVTLDAISNLRNLEILSLNNCEVTNISAVAGFSKLKRLEIHYNNVTDLTPIANNTSLKEIYLSGIKVPIDVDTLLTLPALETLQLTECTPLTTGEIAALEAGGVSITPNNP